MQRFLPELALAMLMALFVLHWSMQTYCGGVMLRGPSDLRRIAPSVMSGVSGLYIIVRIWRLSRAPAQLGSLPRFLFSHADLLGVLCGYPIIVWRLGQPEDPRQSLERFAAAARSAAIRVSRGVHELRQTFTVLMMGLGLIERRARAGQTAEVILMARRLIRILDDGMDAVKSFEAVEEQLRSIARIEVPSRLQSKPGRRD